MGGSIPSWSISPFKIIDSSSGGSLSDRPFRADANSPLTTDLIDTALGDRRLITQGYEMDIISWVDDHFLLHPLNNEAYEIWLRSLGEWISTWSLSLSIAE